MTRVCSPAFFAPLAVTLLQVAGALAQPAPRPDASPAAPGAAPPSADATPTPAEPASADDVSAATSWEAASAEESPAAAAEPAAAAPTPPAPEREAPVVSTPLDSESGPAPTPDESAPGLDALGSHQQHFYFGLGVRTSYVNDGGLDPFAEDDALLGLRLGAGRALFASRSLSVALGARYEVGGSTASARGDATHLLTQRLLLAPELRNHLWSKMYVYAVPAFGLLRTKASLDEGASGATLEAKHWGSALDLTAGAALELYGKVSGERASTRLWVFAEGGYGWGSKTHLTLHPDGDSGGPERVAPLPLGDLTLRGPTFTLGAHLSY